MTSTVVIGGRPYKLRGVGELTKGELAQLVDAGRSVTRARRLARLGRRPRAVKVSRLLDRTIRVLLPDLEPHVLRDLPFDARVEICDTWAAAAGG